jgi:glyoxylase-like metal-dependent hydrolase (beta-lactamase superfamily II)
MEMTENPPSVGEWFEIRAVSSGVWLISEPHHVNSFLVVGTERAVLIDSGMGIGDIAAAVDAITSLPVTVVNTHHHFDHVGGNWQFSDTAIHTAGAASLMTPVPSEWLSGYAAHAGAMAESWSEYLAADDRFFRLVDEEHHPRSLPSSFSWDRWKISPPMPTRLLEDGDRFDLGGRTLEIIHTPGHTQDSICVLDPGAGILFAGDTLVTGPLYAHLPDSDLDRYAKSLELLSDLAPDIETILLCHMLRYHAGRELIVRSRAAVSAVLDGRTVPRKSIDIFGDETAEHWHEGLSVVRPPGQ